MVIIQLTGGLGNQMFQYATARRLAWFFETPLKLDVTLYQYDPLRTFGLHHFKISGEIADPEEIFWIKQIKHLKEQGFSVNWELIHGFSPEEPDVYLEGYWQSEKYFRDIREIICEEFSLKEELDAENLEYLERIKTSESVSIHIRRGDYVTNPTVNYLHGVCILDYYSRAMEAMAQCLEEPHFFIFSDDIQWGKDNLPRDYPLTFVDINGPDRDFYDLFLIRHCKHHIIANSSFSWWGAWLSDHPGKLVYAPQKWFQGYSHDTRDLLPEHWNRI